MTATLNGMYNSAPDTPSPVYPDRLIRPLPKRTLRSRLSIDATDAELFPATPSTPHVFYGSSVDNGDGMNESKVYVQQGDGLDHPLEADVHLHFENGIDLESGDEDSPVVVRRSAGFRGSSLSPTPSSAPHPSNGDPSQTKSSTTGPDGYDAFENTNNKKKRKIPTPGNLGHHSTLSPEFSTMGLANPAQSPSATPGDGSHVSTFYGTGSPASPVASGISGAGRGRLGRNTVRNNSGRGPLSVQTQFGWPHGRAGRREAGSGDSPSKPDQGIISAAIANAAASALSPSPSSRNVSMLDRQPPTTPTKTQFTFTCESDSSKGMAMQTQNAFSQRSGRYGSHAREMSPPSPISPQGHPSQNRAAATMTNTAATANALANVTGNATTAPPTAAASTPTAEQPNPGRKKKRSPGSIYSMAARQRKIQQQYANLHHPPSMEDLWICEFCEYESIFGHPPEALIRQYEIKDRKERKRLAEKKRLLEKAKMKGRKNKKATKNASKHAAAANQPGYDQGYDRASVDQSSGPPDDEYLATRDEYEDEEDPAPPAAAPPAATFKPPLPPGGPPTTTALGGKGTPVTVSEGASSRPP